MGGKEEDLVKRWNSYIYAPGFKQSSLYNTDFAM
jgi:hypothetical protein